MTYIPGAGLDQTTADARYVNIDGDTMSSSLVVSPATGSAVISLTPQSTNQYALLFLRSPGSSARWAVAKSNDTETGDASTGTGGANFHLRRYENSGTYLDSPIIVSRSDGTVTLTKPLYLTDTIPTVANHAVSKSYMDSRTVMAGNGMVGGGNLSADRTFDVAASDSSITVAVDGIAVNTSVIADKTYADTKVSKTGDTMSGALIVTPSAGNAYIDISPSSTGKFALTFYDNTGESSRWAVGKIDDAEGGTSDGSTFQIRRYNNSGSFLDAPLAISRTDGTITILKPLVLTDTTPTAGGHATSKTYVDDGLSWKLDTFGGTLTDDLTIDGNLMVGGSGGEIKADTGFTITNSADADTLWSIHQIGAPRNLVVEAYNDSGVLSSTPLTIIRSTGLATVVGNPTDNLGIATKQYVDARTPKITVSASAPGGAVTGDVWIDVP